MGTGGCHSSLKTFVKICCRFWSDQRGGIDWLRSLDTGDFCCEVIVPWKVWPEKIFKFHQKLGKYKSLPDFNSPNCLFAILVQTICQISNLTKNSSHQSSRNLLLRLRFICLNRLIMEDRMTLKMFVISFKGVIHMSASIDASQLVVVVNFEGLREQEDCQSQVYEPKKITA